MLKELRTSLRAWLRTPGLFSLNVVVLGTGIAGATALYILVHTVLLRPLPYPQADRLVTVSFTAPGIEIDRFDQSIGTYVHFVDQATVFDDFGVYSTAEVALTGIGAPKRLLAGVASPTALSALGVAPVTGRTFLDQEADASSPPVAVLSHRLWQDWFAQDQTVLGRTVQIDGIGREVVGVMPADFAFPAPDIDLWLPMTIDRDAIGVTNFSFRGLARLTETASIAGATEELATFTQTLPVAYPDDLSESFMADSGMRPLIEPLSREVIGSASETLWIALAAVGLVLLIATANVLNLLLVRADSRTHELALRMALGAGRDRLLKRALADGLAVGLPAGLLGGLLALVSLQRVAHLATLDLPRLHELTPGLGTVVCAVVVGALTGAAVGIAASWRVLRPAGSESLRGTRHATASRSSWDARRAFVVVQVAASTALLLAAGLILRSSTELNRVDPGFEPSGLYSLFVTLPQAEYPDADRSRAFWQRSLEQLRSQPGVAAASTVSKLPFDGGGQTGTLVENHPSPDGLAYVFGQRIASRDYFSTASIPLKAGRLFSTDDERRTGSVVVSEALARQFWPSAEAALGQRVRPAGSSSEGRDLEWSTIVGVVGDLRNAGMRELSNPTVYFPLSYEENRFLRSQFLILRAEPGTTLSLESAQRALGAVDANIPVARYRTGEDLLNAETARLRFILMMLAVAALAATLIGGFGLFAMLLTLVTMRRREIGVRLAVGATKSDVRGLVSRTAFGLVAVGGVLGALASFFTTKALGAFLYGVTTFDPLTLLPVLALLATVAALASWLPAARAARVDPMTELRAD